MQHATGWFRIPVEMIRSVVAELIQNGKVERGYLGALISDDKELLASFGVEDGVLIEDVTHVMQQRVRSVDELSQAVEGEDLTEGIRMRVAIPGGPARYVLLSLSE